MPFEKVGFASGFVTDDLAAASFNQQSVLRLSLPRAGPDALGNPKVNVKDGSGFVTCRVYI